MTTHRAPMILVGLTGLAGEGKDYFAQKAIRHLRQYKVVGDTYAMAKPIKVIASRVLLLEKDHFDEIDKDALSPVYYWENMPGYTGKRLGRMTGREILQYFGTEVLRRMNPQVFVDCLGEFLETHPFRKTGGVVFVPDVRFVNEAAYIRRNKGYVVHLSGLGSIASFSGHSSETAAQDGSLIEDEDTTLDSTSHQDRNRQIEAFADILYGEHF